MSMSKAVETYVIDTRFFKMRFKSSRYCFIIWIGIDEIREYHCFSPT